MDKVFLPEDVLTNTSYWVPCNGVDYYNLLPSLSSTNNEIVSTWNNDKKAFLGVKVNVVAGERYEFSISVSGDNTGVGWQAAILPDWAFKVGGEKLTGQLFYPNGTVMSDTLEWTSDVNGDVLIGMRISTATSSTYRISNIEFTKKYDVMRRYASRYAMQVKNDNPLAFFDVLPDVDRMVDFSRMVIDPPHPSILDPARFRWFEVPSQHCEMPSTGYYLHSVNNGASDWPVNAGVPMMFGGVSRTRFALLNRDVSPVEEPLPFLQLPSFGMGRQYDDGARTLEFWMEAEPYTNPLNVNAFDDQTGILNPLNEHEHYTTNSPGGIGLNVSTTPSIPSSGSGSSAISVAGDITFIKDNPILVGKKKYTFSIHALAGTQGQADVSFEFTFAQEKSDGTYFSEAYTYNVTVTNAGWQKIDIEFVVPENMAYPKMQLTITTNSTTYFTMMGLWFGSGGSWQKPGIDVEADVQYFSNAKPRELMSIGGRKGTAISLWGDAEYLYLVTGEETDTYYVGEWGRPMLVSLVDSLTRVSLYINGEIVMSVKKSDKELTTQNSVIGEYVLFYISPLFKYIDLNSICLFSEELPDDLIKLHYLFGVGPHYSTAIQKMPYERMYVADGATTSFSNTMLFPKTQSFLSGTSHGVSVYENYLRLPEYPKPQLIGTTYDDIEFSVKPDVVPKTLSNLVFSLPVGSYMRWQPKKDIGDNINYIFLDFGLLLDDEVIPPPTTKLFSVESGAAGESVDFTFEYNLTLSNGNIVSYGSVVGTLDDIEVFNELVTQPGFSIVINIKDMTRWPDYRVGAIFSDRLLSIVIGDEAEMRAISCCSEDLLQTSNILYDGESGLNNISIDYRWDEVNIDKRNLMNSVEYMLYPNSSEVFGAENPYIETSVNGYWEIDIPLDSFASHASGEGSVDFILYNDGERVPRLITGISSNLLTYQELMDYIIQYNKKPASSTLYSDAQAMFGSDTYNSIGLDVKVNAPTLSRLSLPSVETYVTLNSLKRWPNKKYSDLSIEKSGTSFSIDFDKSQPSVLDTKWELMNGFAIIISPKITLRHYTLGYYVHMHSEAQKIKNPIFRKADFFGVSAKDSTLGKISTGTGSSIYLYSTKASRDIKRNSGRIPTESLPSMMMPKSFGFAPYRVSSSMSSVDVDPFLLYELSSDNAISSMSFMMLWSSETFPYDTTLYPSYIDTVGQIRHGAGGVNQIDVNVQTQDLTKYQSAYLMVNNSDVYVDGQNSNIIRSNRWHFVQIDFDTPMTDAFILQSNRYALLNYVASHRLSPKPEVLYGARTGLPSISVSDYVAPKMTNESGRVLLRTSIISQSEEFVFRL